MDRGVHFMLNTHVISTARLNATAVARSHIAVAILGFAITSASIVSAQEGGRFADHPRPPMEGRGHGGPGFGAGPGGPGGSEFGRFGGPRPEPTPEEFAAEVERAMKFMEEHFPGMHEHMSNLKSRSPRLFERRMRMMLPRMTRMMDHYENDPVSGEMMIKEHRLNFEIRMRAERLLGTEDEAARSRLRDELRSIVRERFETRLQLRKAEIGRLERRINAVKENLARDERQMETIIDREVDDIIAGDGEPPEPR